MAASNAASKEVCISEDRGLRVSDENESWGRIGCYRCVAAKGRMSPQRASSPRHLSGLARP